MVKDYLWLKNLKKSIFNFSLDLAQIIGPQIIKDSKSNGGVDYIIELKTVANV